MSPGGQCAPLAENQCSLITLSILGLLASFVLYTFCQFLVSHPTLFLMCCYIEYFKVYCQIVLSFKAPDLVTSPERGSSFLKMTTMLVHFFSSIFSSFRRIQSGGTGWGLGTLPYFRVAPGCAGLCGLVRLTAGAVISSWLPWCWLCDASCPVPQLAHL